MGTVISKDGTRIAYDKSGAGPVVILVDGALGYRGGFGQQALAEKLVDHFTVYTYDRRGRGESSDALQESTAQKSGGQNSMDQQSWAQCVVEREVEDLDTLIQEAGGSAYLFGESSGAALVLEAALRLGDKVKKIALYEVPYNDDPTARQAWREYVRQLSELLAAGRHGDAVGLFMKLVGASQEDVDGMRQAPIWPMFESVAPTLAYDHTALFGQEAEVPAERVTDVRVPALVIDGAESFPFMHETAKKLASAMPRAQQRTLEGQSHQIDPAALAPVLVEFFNS